MTVRIDQWEQAVRRYLAAGSAAVVVLLSPGAETPAVDARPTTTVTVAPDPAGGPTAAATLGWGEPVRADEFDASTEGWSRYDGPGHAGEGRRSPNAIAVRDGVLTITGDADGTTGGMSWGDGRRYGRWEARVRVPAGDPSYNAVLLLWPDAENWPEGGEIDFMEIGDADRQEVDVFLHYGEDDDQKHGRVATDATRWHHWAVEWTPTSITTFLDGRRWYRTTDEVVQPPGPMHLCIQLDWFPEGAPVRESTMQVDWVREYGPG